MAAAICAEGAAAAATHEMLMLAAVATLIQPRWMAKGKKLSHLRGNGSRARVGGGSCHVRETCHVRAWFGRDGTPRVRLNEKEFEGAATRALNTRTILIRLVGKHQLLRLRRRTGG